MTLLREITDTYSLAVYSLGVLSLCMVAQLLVADLALIRAGHKPGQTVPFDPQRFHFRATRALANTNESVAIFLIALMFAILSQASASLVAIGAILYVAGRVGHMLCYWLGWALMRSAAFGLGVLGILTLLVAGWLAWW